MIPSDTGHVLVNSSEILGASSGVLYLISAVLLLRAILHGTRVSRKLLVILPAIGGSLLHAFLLLQNVILPNALDLNFINALSLTAWLMSFILLLLAIRQPVEIWALWFYP